MYSSVAKANPNEGGIQNIAVKFYIPGTPSQTLSRATSSSALDTRIPDILGWEGHPVPRHF
jgi:hypothetical protein